MSRKILEKDHNAIHTAQIIHVNEQLKSGVSVTMLFLRASFIYFSNYFSSSVKCILLSEVVFSYLQ